VQAGALWENGTWQPEKATRQQISFNVAYKSALFAAMLWYTTGMTELPK
jgi:hypothetical protein